jgi:hypothetical protein
VAGAAALTPWDLPATVFCDDRKIKPVTKAGLCATKAARLVAANTLIGGTFIQRITIKALPLVP